MQHFLTPFYGQCLNLFILSSFKNRLSVNFSNLQTILCMCTAHNIEGQVVHFDEGRAERGRRMTISGMMRNVDLFVGIARHDDPYRCHPRQGGSKYDLVFFKSCSAFFALLAL